MASIADKQFKVLSEWTSREREYLKEYPDDTRVLKLLEEACERANGCHWMNATEIDQFGANYFRATKNAHGDGDEDMSITLVEELRATL